MFCTVVFYAIVTSFLLGQVSHVVLVCFTVRQKIVFRRIYAKFTALNLLYFKLSYRQRYFARPIHGKVQWKRSALKTKKLTEGLKIKPVLFSRLTDLQNSICYRRLQYHIWLVPSRLLTGDIAQGEMGAEKGSAR